jgi:hypothetical protein
MFPFNAALLTIFTLRSFTEDLLTLPLGPCPKCQPSSIKSKTASTSSPVVDNATKSDISLLNNAMRVIK